MEALTEAHPNAVLPDDAQRKWDAHRAERTALESGLAISQSWTNSRLTHQAKQSSAWPLIPDGMN
jgi:hypothetical protein